VHQIESTVQLFLACGYYLPLTSNTLAARIRAPTQTI
jgi:hypothetical protein